MKYCRYKNRKAQRVQSSGDLGTNYEAFRAMCVSPFYQKGWKYCKSIRERGNVMSDDLKKRGKQDRNKVSQQAHEIAYLVKTTNKPKAQVVAAITSTPSRKRSIVKKKLA